MGILEFPTMSSSGLTRGSLYGILEFFVMRSPDQVGDDTRLGNSRILCDEIPRSSRGMTQGLGILEFLGLNLGLNSRISSVIF